MLRDSETELLFRDISRAADQAAGLDPKSDQGRPAQRSGDQRLRRHRPDGLYPVGPADAADNVNQLQGVIAHELGHVAGGHSIRMQRRRQAKRPGSRIATLVLGALAIAAGARRRRHGHHDGRAAGRDGQLPRLHPHPGKLRRPGRREISRRRRDQRQGQPRILQEAAEPGISPRDLRQGQLRPHPPAVERAHRRAASRSIRRTRRGTGRPTRRSKRASSGSRPSCIGFVDPKRAVDQISRKRPERPGALCPRLCLSSRRLSRQSAGRSRRACSRSPRTTPSSSS